MLDGRLPGGETIASALAKAAHGNRHSPEVKAASLAVLEATGGNLRAAARAVGVSARTIRRLCDELPDDEREKVRHQARGAIADTAITIAARAAAVLCDENVIANIAAGDQAWRLVTVLEKATGVSQLLTGGATERHAFTIDEILAQSTWTKPVRLASTPVEPRALASGA